MEVKSLPRDTILRWKAGDREAGDVVITQFEGMITKLCLRSMEVFDRELLEDLKQECRLRITSDRVRRRYDFRKGELSTFLTWEIKNVLFHQKKGRARKLWRLDQLDASKDLRYDVDYLAEVSGIDRRVEELLNTLPPVKAFVLKARLGFYGDDLKQPEIAKIIGKSRQSVSSYEIQALKALRSSPVAQSLYQDLVAGIL